MECAHNIQWHVAVSLADYASHRYIVVRYYVNLFASLHS